MMRAAVFVLLAGGLSACGTRPPVPDWQVQAHGATERAVAAQLRGSARVAQAEWQRATAEVAATAQPERLARLELLRCAVEQAALQPQACADHALRWPQPALADAAYRRYLAGHPTLADVALLPPAHRAVARWMLATESSKDATSTQAPVELVAAIDEPLARLVAASALLRRGPLSAQGIELAIDTASAQGWRQPLHAWLLLAVHQAQVAGDGLAQQRWQARLRALGGQP